MIAVSRLDVEAAGAGDVQPHHAAARPRWRGAWWPAAPARPARASRRGAPGRPARAGPRPDIVAAASPAGRSRLCISTGSRASSPGARKRGSSGSATSGSRTVAACGRADPVAAPGHRHQPHLAGEIGQVERDRRAPSGAACTGGMNSVTVRCGMSAARHAALVAALAQRVASPRAAGSAGPSRRGCRGRAAPAQEMRGPDRARRSGSAAGCPRPPPPGSPRRHARPGQPDRTASCGAG